MSQLAFLATTSQSITPCGWHMLCRTHPTLYQALSNYSYVHRVELHYITTAPYCVTTLITQQQRLLNYYSVLTPILPPCNEGIQSQKLQSPWQYCSVHLQLMLTLWGRMRSSLSPLTPCFSSSAFASSRVLPFIKASVWAR